MIEFTKLSFSYKDMEQSSLRELHLNIPKGQWVVGTNYDHNFLQEKCHPNKNVLDEISKENDLETRIRDWAKENLTVDSLTVDVDTSTTEEMKYFMITELIRERIMHAFPEVQESYADELTENFYNELFS